MAQNQDADDQQGIALEEQVLSFQYIIIFKQNILLFNSISHFHNHNLLILICAGSSWARIISKSTSKPSSNRYVISPGRTNREGIILFKYHIDLHENIFILNDFQGYDHREWAFKFCSFSQCSIWIAGIQNYLILLLLSWKYLLFRYLNCNISFEG